MKAVAKEPSIGSKKSSSTPSLAGGAATSAIEEGRRARFASNGAYLHTRHLLGDLKDRTVSSTVVSVAAQGGKVALNFLSVIVLTRLLAPKDFGLVAMATGVMGFLRVFRDAGLSIPTVQQEDVTHDQVSNLFWINVALSTCASAFMLALAPAIVWFFREPQLLKITMALAGAFLLGGLTVQHGAIL